MLMKVTHKYLLDLRNILQNPEAIFQEPVPGKIRYKVSMNRKVAAEDVNSVLELYPVSPEVYDYYRQRDEIFKEANIHTDAEFNARPQEERDAINLKIADLDASFKEVLEKEAEMDKARTQLMNDTVEVNLQTMSPDEVLLKEPDGWRVWEILFNNGEGIIREA